MTDSVVTNSKAHPHAVPEFPTARDSGCPFDPPPALRGLQSETPITRVRLWDGSTPWLVTGFDAQRTLFADPGMSADITHPHYPYPNVGVKERRKESRTFLNLDDPEHARLRRMVTGAFTTRRVEGLRPAIQQIVDGLIDDMLAGPRPVDLVEAFALPVPSLVICELLGVPYEEHDFFHANSKILVKRTTTPEEGTAAAARLIDYLDQLIGDRLAHPADDLLSRLAERVTAGEISRREAGEMGVLLLFAGHETTANMIALGTLALLQHPDQMAQLRETNDPKLVASAVEELLRYLTIVHGGRRRVALTDMEIDGQTIRAGEGVILSTDMGNRDPAVFPDPDWMDIHRDARQHVAFGFGAHQCLGQPLARVELQVVYSTLYRRIPALRLAVDLDQVAFKHDGLVFGVYELPVTW